MFTHLFIYNMKILSVVFLLMTIYGCSKPIDTNKTYKQNNMSFQEVWKQLTSDKLDKLPHNQTSFYKLIKNNQIDKDAKRTLANKNDILPQFDKLAHPNGICFKGIWSIDKPTIYGGYFKQNSKALIIARASTALSNTTNDFNRAFGFAGKLFPTTNPNKISQSPTANFFLIDDLGGTNVKHYTDVNLSNEPKVSFNMAILKNLFYAIKITSSFNNADKHSNIRQLYEISYLDENNTGTILTPKWMKIVSSPLNKKIDKKDFRDELTIEDKGKLIFDIYVANKIINKNKHWQQIGTITLDSSVISNSCDHRLHFHHPRYIKE